MSKKARILALATVGAIACLALLFGCAREREQVDSFIETVVVEKLEPATGTDTPGAPRADYFGLKVISLDEERVFLFRLNEAASRPLPYIWNQIDVGTNLAFRYLNNEGRPIYMADGISAVTTADIVVLDEPANLKQLLQMAKERKKKLVLAEEQRRQALREMWEQVNKPLE